MSMPSNNINTFFIVFLFLKFHAAKVALNYETAKRIFPKSA